MAQTWSFSQPLQLNISQEDRDAGLAAGPDLRKREDRPSHSHATAPGAVSPGQHEEVWQAEGSGNTQGQQQQQQVQTEDLPRLLQKCNMAVGLSRRKWQRLHKRKNYFNREDELGQEGREEDLGEQDPCVPSSSGCRRQGGQGQRRSPVHRPQHKQRKEGHRQTHDWWRKKQHTDPFLQDQAGDQGTQEEGLLWNVKKHRWAKISEVPPETLQEASRRLRPMNMAGYCLPGMCSPFHSNKDIGAKHEYTWRNEGGEVMPTENSKYSSAAEDLLLVDPLPFMAQREEGTSTEEDENTQPVFQG